MSLAQQAGERATTRRAGQEGSVGSSWWTQLEGGGPHRWFPFPEKKFSWFLLLPPSVGLGQGNNFPNRRPQNNNLRQDSLLSWWSGWWLLT